MARSRRYDASAQKRARIDRGRASAFNRPHTAREQSERRIRNDPHTWALLSDCSRTNEGSRAKKEDVYSARRRETYDTDEVVDRARWVMVGDDDACVCVVLAYACEPRTC